MEEDAATKYDPIRVEDLNYNSEWMADLEGPSDDFVYFDDGLRWVDVEAASGAADHPGPSTRSGQAQPFTYQRSMRQFEEDELDE